MPRAPRPARSAGFPPHDDARLSRRDFLAVGAGTLGWLGLGCRSPRQEAGRFDDAFAAAPDAPRSFPLLDVSGEPYAVGLAVGRRFADEIRRAIGRRREWFDALVRFAENEGKPAFEEMIRNGRERTPAAYEEARGTADGAGVPLREILAFNCRSELEAAQKEPDARTGCSTIVVADPARILVAHNEDGDMAYADSMYLVRVRPPSGVRFLALCYPGIVPGNAPAINDRGVVMITNYIGTVAWRAGIPRYFLDRMALEAKSVEDAIRIATDPFRAYGFHHILAEKRNGRLRAVSLEVTPDRSEIRDLSGVYIHTNHLILDSLREEPQESEYVGRSSKPRLETLTADAAKFADPSKITGDDLVRMLSSHAGRPFSPCRHPEGDIRGTTIACAVFDVGARRERLFRGNPCAGASTEYEAPTPSDVA